MSETRLRIAEMGLDHYRESADWEHSQVKALGAFVDEIAAIIELKPGGDPSEGWVCMIWSIADMKRRLRALAEATHVQEDA